MSVFLIILIAIIGVGIMTQIVQSKFKKNRMHFSSIASSANITGAQVAAEILERNNIKNVRILKDTKEGRDHYDPKKNEIVLSPSVHDSSSIAALAIAAHECGHAIQWGRQEVGIKIRDAIAKPAMIASQMASMIMSMWLILLIFGSFGFIFWAGLVLYAATSIFQLATLPVEFGASRKAKKQLKEMGYITNEQEEKGTNELLNSAAMTYVVAAISSLVMLAVYVLIILSRRR